MADALALASSVGGLVTAVAALLAILEMKRQRAIAYRPHLLLIGKTVDLVMPLGAENALTFPRPMQSDAPPDSDDVMPVYSARLDILNTGVGTAIHVFVTWRFDLQELLARIRREPGSQELTFDVTTSANVEDTDLMIKFPNDARYWHNLRNRPLVELPLVLAASVRSEPYTIELPGAYLHLLCILVRLLSLKDGESVGSSLILLDELPKLTVTFEYLDLENTPHRVSYSVQPWCSPITGESEREYQDDPASLANVGFEVEQLNERSGLARWWPSRSEKSLPRK